MTENRYKDFYDKLNNRFLLFAGATILIFLPGWMYVEDLNRRGVDYLFSESTRNYLGLSSLIITLIFISLWHIQYHRSINKISKEIEIIDRLLQYKKYFIMLIIRMASLSILISFSYIIIRSDAMIAAYAVCLVLISMNRLTPGRIARQLRFTKEEKKQFLKNLGMI